MISIENLSLSYSGTDIFSNISLLINPKDRIGLVGKNGAGKSTLLKIVAGLLQPTQGSVVIPKDTTIGYLPQQMTHQEGKTVIEDALTAFSHIHSLQNQIDTLTSKIENHPDHSSKEYHDLLDKLTNLYSQLSNLEPSTIQAQAERTLSGLGFAQKDFTRQTKEFSGGWRMRIELAKILLQKPNILLLDEPTNHLDIQSIYWLESYLKTFNGAIILVSHDRTFLDNITTQTAEISLGKLYTYKEPYSKYLALREEFRKNQIAAYNNQQKFIQDTQDFINKFRYKPTKAVQVQSRIKQLEKLEIIEVDPDDNAAINIKFPPAPRSGQVPVQIKDLSKAFGAHKVLDNISLDILRGEKVAFLGQNGQGKSTLSKIIMQQLQQDSGEMKIGHNVNIGYFAQNQDEIMDNELTVFQTIDNIAVGDIRTKIRDLLAAFLFRNDDIDKKVKVLSGGERSRLALVKLLLQPYNLLLLDEPTNHLDIRSKEILKQALIEYDGTLILISHDRYFLNGLTSKMYNFKNGAVKEYLGTIEQYLIDTQTVLPEQAQTTQNTQQAQRVAETAANTTSQVSYTEKKQRDKLLRKAQNDVQNIEEKIASLEREIEASEQLLASQTLSAEEIKEVSESYQMLQNQLDAALLEWEKASEAYSEMLKV